MTKKAICFAFSLLNVMIGCKSDSTPVVRGNRIGESYAQFSAISQPDIDAGPTLAYTGKVHCYRDDDIGDKCKGHAKEVDGIDSSRMPFSDNSHYTFVAGKLVKIESIGNGGLIGSSAENLNWNEYLNTLTTRFGKPDRQNVKEALWLHNGYVIHAYLTFSNLPFSGNPAHEEHIVIEDRNYYDQEDRTNVD